MPFSNPASWRPAAGATLGRLCRERLCRATGTRTNNAPPTAAVGAVAGEEAAAEAVGVMWQALPLWSVEHHKKQAGEAAAVAAVVAEAQEVAAAAACAGLNRGHVAATP